MRAREHEARMAEVRRDRVEVRSARKRDELVYAKSDGLRVICRLAEGSAGYDRFPGNKNNLTNGGTRKRGAFPDGGTARTDGRVCDERPSDGERQFIFVVFRERVTEVVGVKCSRRNLAELSEVEYWEQYRAVNGGASLRVTERTRRYC